MLANALINKISHQSTQNIHDLPLQKELRGLERIRERWGVQPPAQIIPDHFFYPSVFWRREKKLLAYSDI